MKTKNLFLTALAAIALVSCADSEFVGENSANDVAAYGDGSINFGFDLKQTTRATLSGSDAATALNKQFVVYGTKHTDAELSDATKDEVVFKNYVVTYKDNSATSTESNTHNWEYVGESPYASGVTPTVTQQDIKYWDWSAANGYTFYAFAGKSQLEGSKVTVTKLTADGDDSDGTNVYGKGYTVTTASGVDLGELYFSDRTPVARGSYGDPVVLTFRNLSAKVRVGFYETVPGYEVHIDKFYKDADAAAVVTDFAVMEDDDADNFVASYDNVSASAANTLTVTYYDNTVTDVENRPKVKNSTATYLHTLTLGEEIQDAAKLKTTANDPTWDKAGYPDNYTTVFPNEANNNPMLIKVDYTLTAEDGSGETIEVKGARVVVPAQYLKWKSNFAYTYIFKIAPNSNGKTDPSQPNEGLYPITFDAIAVTAEDKIQETITTVATNSVTTYANGAIVNEYKSGTPIYVVNTNTATNAVIAPSEVGGATGKVRIYSVTGTGDKTEATVLAKILGADNNLTLTATTGGEAATLVQYVPLADGTQLDFGANGVTKFTPSGAGTYAYAYSKTGYVAPTYASVSSEAFSALTTYYFKVDAKEIYYTASGITADNFADYKAELYKMTDAGTPGDYDVKVIKVVAP